jgi:hypothetical protein
MPLCQILSSPQELDALSTKIASQLHNKREIQTDEPTTVIFRYDWIKPLEYLGPFITAKARYRRRTMDFADILTVRGHATGFGTKR